MKPEHKGLLLRLLINRAHGQATENILKAFPQEEAQFAKAHQISSSNIEPLLIHAKKVLPQIHYSWLTSEVKQQNPSFYAGIAGCLEEEQKQGFCRHLNISFPSKPLSPFLKRFYLHHLYTTFPLLSESLPLEYAPESPLNALARLSKKQLIELIDKLAMFDLAHELKTIVGTKLLKTLYTCLSVPQQQFLRQCMHLKDKLTPVKLGLKTWTGEPKELLLKLHKRGLSRLALALSGQSEELIWLIVHTLDVGRGSLLKKLIKPNPIPGVTDNLILQVQMATEGIA